MIKTYTKYLETSGKHCALTAMTFALFCLALLVPANHALALDANTLPTGGSIDSGSASITSSGNTMTVNQTSQKIIANWDTFNIGTNASVTFNQPGTSAAALNRISNQSPSQILGSLSANGQVFLINPAGILFGASAKVNASGLVASTLDISDNNFLNGNYTFNTGNTAGSITNAGRITADGGYVAFLSPIIENTGTVTADKGAVAMAAANKVSLDFSGDGLITYTIDQGAVDAQMKNSGLIRADEGLVYITARAADDLTCAVVNNSGVIEAKGISEDGGQIMLLAQGGQTTVSGTLDASSENGTGGKVVVTGDRVLVNSGAHLNASGATGGGSVLVGGSWQGSDDSIYDATGTIVASGTLLEANATINGNGGTVVAWSDIGNEKSVTRAYGTFEANGGVQGGDGGRIETSGHWLDTAGASGSAGATSGSAGLWLFDPYNITITDVSATASGNWSGDDPDSWTPSGNSSTILNTDLNTKLETTDVTITTSGGGNEAGDILVEGAITIGEKRTLKLLADGKVDINAGISGAGANLFLESGAGGAVNKSITINNYINLNDRGKLTLTSTGGATSNAEIDAFGLLALYGTGDFKINWTNGTSDFDYFTANLTGNSSIDLYENRDFFHITEDGITCSGDVTLRSVKDFDVDGPINITGDGNLTLSVGDGSYIKVSAPITLNSGAVAFSTESGTSTYTVNDSITASGAGLTFDQAVTLGGTAQILANGSLVFNAALGFTSDANCILAANDFSFSGNVIGDGSQKLTLMSYSASDDIDVGTGGDVDTTASQFTGFSSLTLGCSDGTGTLTVVGDTQVSADQLELANKTVKVTGGSVSNTSGDIIFTADTFDITRSITANQGTGKVTIRQITAANAITLGSGITNDILSRISAGTLEIGRTNGGDVSFDGNITTDTDDLIVLSNGDITLGSGVTLNVGTGTAVFAAAGNFINNSGATAINTSGSGRWLIYSTDPAANTFGGLASGNTALWNKTYAGYSPGSVVETGNRYLFSIQPTVSVIALDQVKTYGETLDLSNPVLGSHYTVTGLVDAAAYGSVFTQDKISGAPAMASTGAAAGADVTGSPYALTLTANTLNLSTGYAAQFTGSTVTVEPAALTVTAADDSKTKDDTAYSGGNGVTFTGFVNGEDTGVLSGSLAYGGASQGAVNAGRYTISPFGFNADNYALTFVDGVLTIKSDSTPTDSGRAIVEQTGESQTGQIAAGQPQGLSGIQGSNALVETARLVLQGDTGMTLASGTSLTTVDFQQSGQTITLHCSNDAGGNAMANIGALSVFTFGLNRSAELLGNYTVQESSSAVSLTKTVGTQAGSLDTKGLKVTDTVPFSLGTVDGGVVEMEAGITENGVLVLFGVQGVSGIDMEQGILLGLQAVKQNLGTGLNNVKSVVISRAGHQPAGTII